MNTRATTSSRRNRAARRVWLAATSGLLAACAGVVIAQHRVNTQVNRQIYGNTSSSVQYGRSYQPNYANNPTYNLLPSENRNLLYRSGALPSTIRMNHASVGPMAPQGVTAYVPQPESFRSSAISPGNYVNTMSNARVNPTPAQPAPVMPKMPSAAAAGSVRYSSSIGGTPVAGFSFNNSLPPAQASYSQMVSSGTTNWTPQNGSVKFSY